MQKPHYLVILNQDIEFNMGCQVNRSLEEMGEQFEISVDCH